MTTDPNAALRIRPAHGSDAAVLTEFNRAMARETEDKELDADIVAAGVAGVLDEPRRGFYLVAEADDHVVGCLMITYEWSDWRNGEWWWLQSVYVRPEHRGGGVFGALYGEVERRAGDTHGVIGVRLYVDLANEKAQRVYQSLAMERTHYALYEKLF